MSRVDQDPASAQDADLRARLAQLTMAMDQMHQGLCIYDPQRRLVFGNQAYTRALGLEPDALRPGMHFRQVIEAMRSCGHRAGLTVHEIEDKLRELLRGTNGGEANLVRADGQTFAINNSRTADGHWVTTFADITGSLGAQRRTEAALAESEERFRLAAEAAGFGVWDYDTTLARRSWSGRLREIFGFGAEVDPSLEVAMAQVHAEDRVAFLLQVQRIRHDADYVRFEATVRVNRANDGELRWITMNCWKTARANSPMGRIIMTVRDVTDEKLAEERIVWSATHDALTGLANRSCFHAELQLALQTAAARGKAFGLMLLDIDRFKQVNDTLGHDAGDRLLETFAARLRGALRAEDTIARIGGDEFAVILGEVGNRQDVTALARSILKRISQPFMHNGRVLESGASIGAALYPMHGRSVNELMKHADLALYASKAAGRGTSTLFDPGMKAQANRQASTLWRARRALADDRLLPYYQPKVDLRTGTVIGLEALLRWRSANGRVVEPSGFGHAFEDLDLANAISDRLITRVVNDIGAWLDQGIAFGHVAVNTAAAEFRREEFAEQVLARLAKAGISTKHFELEVTETALAGHGAEDVFRALALLSREGVRIALDDFGTGHASLHHLKQFPVNTIKIDAGLVRDMEEDPRDQAIIRAVIGIGAALGIEVVAEGIERRSQADLLVDLNCAIGQGCLFSRAVPASRVPALLASRPFWVNSETGRLHSSGLRLMAG